jgi:hypothetical protein
MHTGGGGFPNLSALNLTARPSFCLSGCDISGRRCGQVEMCAEAAGKTEIGRVGAIEAGVTAADMGGCIAGPGKPCRFAASTQAGSSVSYR